LNIVLHSQIQGTRRERNTRRAADNRINIIRNNLSDFTTSLLHDEPVSLSAQENAEIIQKNLHRNTRVKGAYP
jgi:hypothetical protein